jgi:hypothetical protein
MKYLLLALLVCAPAFCQTFKISANSGRTDLNLCQENHNLILNKMLRQTDSQIVRLVRGIEEETQINQQEFRLNAYHGLLHDLIIKRIVFNEIKKKLNVRKLKDFFESRENYNKPYLIASDINVDLDKEINSVLGGIVGPKLELAPEFQKKLKKKLESEAKKSFMEARYREVGASIFTQLTTNVISNGLKSISISLASKIFMNAAKGSIITLLTFPLHGYRLPPETLWTDLLEKHPELIFVPEWMKHGGISDHPWMSHCNAIQRRTKQMENALTKILKLEEGSFINSVINIDDMQDPKTISPPEATNRYPRPVVDNTYVRPPVLINRRLPPAWAIK